MQRPRDLALVGAVGLIAVVAIVAATVLWPRFAQLRTATTDAGGAVLLAVFALLVIAAVLPILVIGSSFVWRPALASLGVLGIGCVVVLSFDQRAESDGLFVLALGVAAAGTVALSCIAALLLRWVRPAADDA